MAADKQFHCRNLANNTDQNSLDPQWPDEWNKKICGKSKHIIQKLCIKVMEDQSLKKTPFAVKTGKVVTVCMYTHKEGTHTLKIVAGKQLFPIGTVFFQVLGIKTTLHSRFGAYRNPRDMACN